MSEDDDEEEVVVAPRAAGARRGAAARKVYKVGRCRLTASKPVLRAPIRSQRLIL
jgi:hypothetical protein